VIEDSYKTIMRPTEGLYKEKGSKFLAYAYPISQDSDISEHLAELRKKHHDARHHCYAYILGMENPKSRANDDGEPGHSAGDPILGQIRSYGLVNVLVVVVRYFGGTKLGVGGLISAYKTAASEALSLVKSMEVYPEKQFVILFGYDETASVERILNQFEIKWRDRAYIDICEFRGTMRKSDYTLFEEKIVELRVDSISLTVQK